MTSERKAALNLPPSPKGEVPLRKSGNADSVTERAVAGTEKRKPGRPRKIEATDTKVEKRSRGRPKKAEQPPPPAKRPRGRPRKTDI